MRCRSHLRLSRPLTDPAKLKRLVSDLIDKERWNRRVPAAGLETASGWFVLVMGIDVVPRELVWT